MNELISLLAILTLLMCASFVFGFVLFAFGDLLGYSISAPTCFLAVTPLAMWVTWKGVME